MTCLICTGPNTQQTSEFCYSAFTLCAMSQVCKIFAGEQQLLMESAIKAY